MSSASVFAYLYKSLTLKGLLGTLTSPQVMMIVCLMGLTGVYTHMNVPSPLSVILMSMVQPSTSLMNKNLCQLRPVQAHAIKMMLPHE